MVAVWGDSSYYPVRGIEAAVYAQDLGWVIGGFNLKLSAGSIKEFTRLLSLRKSKPPNCELIWNTKLGVN